MTAAEIKANIRSSSHHRSWTIAPTIEGSDIVFASPGRSDISLVVHDHEGTLSMRLSGGVGTSDEHLLFYAGQQPSSPHRLAMLLATINEAITWGGSSE